MAAVPIVQLGDILVATVQDELEDRDAIALQERLGELIERADAVGVLLDLTLVETVDSFLGRVLHDIASEAQLLGATTVVVGIQPAVAITLVELGLDLKGVHTALTADRGMARLRRLLAEQHGRGDDDG